MNPKAMQWIVGHDTGTSSKTIWAVMMMAQPEDADVPYDPDDFGRCYRLLKLIPEWRTRLDLVAMTYPAWMALVREWDRLTEMFERVIGPSGTGWDKAASGAMYEAMQPLIDEGRIAAGWKRTGPNSWEGPGIRTVRLSAGTLTRHSVKP